MSVRPGRLSTCLLDQEDCRHVCKTSIGEGGSEVRRTMFTSLPPSLLDFVLGRRTLYQQAAPIEIYAKTTTTTTETKTKPPYLQLTNNYCIAGKKLHMHILTRLSTSSR